MSVAKGENATTSQDELVTKHRSEKKDLQAQIQQMKKSINKDKKRKKEIIQEIAQLEENLKVRHAKEIEELNEDSTTQQLLLPCATVELSNDLAAAALVQDDASDNDITAASNDDNVIPTKKISKAEKRRQKKSEANREHEAKIKEELEESKYCARNVEANKIKLILRSRNMKMHEIQPDGNCMFAAIGHQLSSIFSVSQLRAQAADFMLSNVDDFAPFMTDPKTGEMLTPEQFKEYCHLVETSTIWGGQPELRALSQTLKRRVEVIQAEGAPIIFGEEFQSTTILLTYYRHYYGLGEHYNSVLTLTSTTNSAENSS